LILAFNRAAIFGFVSHGVEATRVPGDGKAGSCLRPRSATCMGVLPLRFLPFSKLLSRIVVNSGC